MNRIALLLVVMSLLLGSESDIEAVRLNHPLQIDAKLTESLYSSQPFQRFIQSDPDNGEPATENTEVWIGYDDAAVYVGARLWDSEPDSIIARMGRRDDDTNSDLFQVAIDSYHDRRSGFFFTVNPSGTIMDGTISNDSWTDDTWDGVWECRTAIDKKGWTVEMRIPFSQLRFNQQKQYSWGIGLGRMIQRRNEQALNVHIPRGESGLVSHFPTLNGISNIKPPKRIETLPYLTSGYSLLPSEQDNPFFNGRDNNLGVGADFKLGIGSNVTIDGTINPDFGQVEVDPSVINLSAYETFYREKRPFFVEGASIFSFGQGGPTNRWGFNFFEPDFFYSRRIGRPPRGEVSSEGSVDIPSATSILGAAKISGKINGDWSIGSVTALTRREYARVNNDGNISREEVEPLTSYNLIRSQKEFNNGLQGLGVLGTYVHRSFHDGSLRDILSDNAVTFGMDGWTFLNEEKDWVIAGWGGFSEVAGSRTRMVDLQQNSSHYFQRPDADHVSLDSTITRMRGFATRLILNKESGHVFLNSALGVISPGFESNDMGLTFGTDQINKHIVAGYNWYDPGKTFRRAEIGTAYMSNHNFGGIKTSERFFLFGFAQLLNYWSFNGFIGAGPRTLSDTKLRGGPMVISPSGGFGNFQVRSDNRKDIIYSVGAQGWSSEKGEYSREISGEIEIKLGTRLNLSVGPEYSIDRTIDQYVEEIADESVEAMYGKRYIMAQLNQKTVSADLRVNLTFTPTLSLQAYFQPFISTGHYSRFKEFKKPRTYDFMVYGEDGTTVEEVDDGYLLYPTGGENDDAFFIENPDFNYKALVGTAVLRWEFKPGSTLYLVWTRNGYDEQHPGDFQFRRDMRDLLGTTTDNVFAVKVAYWLGR